MNAVQDILSERNENMARVFGSEALPWNKLAKFDSIQDVKQWIVNILAAVKEYLDGQQDRRYRTIVSDIKRIIEQEYATIQNVGDIVHSLYISSSYANRLFKQYEGMSLFEYLVKIRMDKARQMLEDPYRKIYDISESVGYVSKSYFSSLFKETTGMSPKQYRDRCGK
jgi:two-component system, response regulator YesN